MKTILISVVFFSVINVSAMAEKADFENDTPGTSPRGWTITMTGKGNPKWTVEKDDSAPSASNVLKQTGKATYPLALKDATSIKDGFVEVKFKAISGSEDRAAGLVWRAKDDNNYYVVRANALENNVVLYKTIGGKRSSLDIIGRRGGYGVKVPVPASSWHTLRVEFAGSRFKVIFNGNAVLRSKTRLFPSPGKSAFGRTMRAGRNPSLERRYGGGDHKGASAADVSGRRGQDRATTSVAEVFAAMALLLAIIAAP